MKPKCDSWKRSIKLISLKPEKLRKKRGHKLLISEMKALITTDPLDIEKNSKGYYEKLYFEKLDKLDEMEQLFKRHKLSKLIQEHI